MKFLKLKLSDTQVENKNLKKLYERASAN